MDFEFRFFLFQRHMKAQHGPPITVTCPYCPATYNYVQSLKTHRRRNHKAEDELAKEKEAQRRRLNIEKLSQSQ